MSIHAVEEMVAIIPCALPWQAPPGWLCHNTQGVHSLWSIFSDSKSNEPPPMSICYIPSLPSSFSCTKILVANAAFATHIRGRILCNVALSQAIGLDNIHQIAWDVLHKELPSAEKRRETIARRIVNNTNFQ